MLQMETRCPLPVSLCQRESAKSKDEVLDFLLKKQILLKFSSLNESWQLGSSSAEPSCQHPLSDENVL